MAVCSVCEEETNYQKFLNCGNKEKHKLCKICVEKIAKPAADVNLGKKVQCPFCRKFTSLPNGDAGKLRTKLFVEMVCEDCLLSKDIQDQCWCKTCEATTCSLCIKEKHRKHKQQCSNWEKHDVTKELLTFFQQREEIARCEGFRRKFKEFSQQLETKLLENFKTEQNYSELFDSIEYCFGTLPLCKPKQKEISISNFRKKYTIVGDLMKSMKLAVPAIDINDICQKVEKDVEVSIDFPELNEVLKLFVVNNSTSTAPKEATKVTQNENGYSITEVQSEKEKGNQAYLRKDFATAHKHYDRCIDLDLRNITFILNKSAVYFEEGEYDDCICLCLKAVDIGQVNIDNNRRDMAKAYSRAARAGLKQQKLNKALHYFDQSLAEYQDPEIVKQCLDVSKTFEKHNQQATEKENLKKKQKYIEATKVGVLESDVCNRFDDPQISKTYAVCDWEEGSILIYNFPHIRETKGQFWKYHLTNHTWKRLFLPKELEKFCLEMKRLEQGNLLFHTRDMRQLHLYHTSSECITQTFSITPINPPGYDIYEINVYCEVNGKVFISTTTHEGGNMLNCVNLCNNVWDQLIQLPICFTEQPYSGNEECAPYRILAECYDNKIYFFCPCKLLGWPQFIHYYDIDENKLLIVKTKFDNENQEWSADLNQYFLARHNDYAYIIGICDGLPFGVPKYINKQILCLHFPSLTWSTLPVALPVSKLLFPPVITNGGIMYLCFKNGMYQIKLPHNKKVQRIPNLALERLVTFQRSSLYPKHFLPLMNTVCDVSFKRMLVFGCYLYDNYMNMNYISTNYESWKYEFCTNSWVQFPIAVSLQKHFCNRMFYVIQLSSGILLFLCCRDLVSFNVNTNICQKIDVDTGIRLRETRQPLVFCEYAGKIYLNTSHIEDEAVVFGLLSIDYKKYCQELNGTSSSQTNSVYSHIVHGNLPGQVSSNQAKSVLFQNRLYFFTPTSYKHGFPKVVCYIDLDSNKLVKLKVKVDKKIKWPVNMYNVFVASYQDSAYFIAYGYNGTKHDEVIRYSNMKKIYYFHFPSLTWSILPIGLPNSDITCGFTITKHGHLHLCCEDGMYRIDVSANFHYAEHVDWEKIDYAL